MKRKLALLCKTEQNIIHRDETSIKSELVTSILQYNRHSLLVATSATCWPLDDNDTMLGARSFAFFGLVWWSVAKRAHLTLCTICDGTKWRRALDNGTGSAFLIIEIADFF